MLSVSSRDAVQITTFGSEFPRNATCPELLPYWPYPQFTLGVIGIVAKSRTLGCEAVASRARTKLCGWCGWRCAGGNKLKRSSGDGLEGQ